MEVINIILILLLFWNCYWIWKHELDFVMVSLMQFEMAQEYFKPAGGGLLVDVSCGSGLFSRKFAKSGAYSKVIALDFSENMLRQCYDYVKQDDTISTT